MLREGGGDVHDEELLDRRLEIFELCEIARHALLGDIPPPITDRFFSAAGRPGEPVSIPAAGRWIRNGEC